MNLFKHQQDAVQFALKSAGKCALFHDPGCGKTRTTLEVFTQFKKVMPELRLLVVCPISLINSAWIEDIHKFTSFTAEPYARMGARIPDIVIINYELLISKRILPEIRNMVIKNPFMCALDESSRLKNNKSITTKDLLYLAPYFIYRMVLSGTPMPNSELELWGQIRFLRSDIFDKSFYAFRNKYFHLERNGKQMVTQGQIMNRMMMRNIMMQGWKYTISQFNREHLMFKIKDCAHWVRKEDALDLPEKIDQIREVTLSGPEQKAYNDMRDLLVAEISGQTVAAPVALTKIMKLRQSTSGFLYNADGVALPTGKTKIHELEDTLEELGNQQVIIFVEFKYEIEQISAMLAKKYGADQVVTLYSGTTDKDSSIKQFQNGAARYLVAHPKSAAHGLTFVNCNTIVFYSLDYSWESHEQARNRTHRIGQKNKCLYIYIIAKDTIDETLLAVLQKKKDLQEIVYAITRNKTQNLGKKSSQKEVSVGLGI
jgi:SNF2 family DNA or RNA helicase